MDELNGGVIIVTENKRFRVTIGNENDVRLVDYIDNRQLISITFKEYKDAVNCRDALMYQCNLMNELAEENQELKSFNQDLAEELSVCANARISKDNQIERLEEKIQRERNSFTKTQARWSKEAETKIKELTEENEQLKQLLNEAEDIILCQTTPHYQRQWENIKNNIKGDVE